MTSRLAVAEACHPAVCENGGACSEVPTGVTCTCGNKFYGSRCEKSEFGSKRIRAPVDTGGGDCGSLNLERKGDLLFHKAKMKNSHNNCVQDRHWPPTPSNRNLASPDLNLVKLCFGEVSLWYLANAMCR